MRRFAGTLAALAIALFVGHVTDKTTGQALSGVTVQAAGEHGTATATTDHDGRFEFEHLTPGRYTLTLSSKDVPVQVFHITVTGEPQSVSVKACSTTLDYECGSGSSSPSSGG
ncbi:MAG: carboxypeptidase regulatory-like domain-containing protein [Vulcanimicrobiaceae bacterium]